MQKQHTALPYPTYDAYKDSGVEWLGEIPKHWEVRRLKNLCNMLVSNIDKHIRPLQEEVELCNYVDVYKNDSITENLDFMLSSASKEQINKFKIRKNDVLITKDSEDWMDIGVPSLVEYEKENLICGYHLAILRPNENLRGNYLAKMLQTPPIKTQFSINANGITRYGISQGSITSTWLILPPKSEQTAIANFLDEKCVKIKQAIAQKENLIKLLQERKQIVIQKAVTKGLDPDVPMKDSGVDWIGEIPEHWEVKRVKHLFKLIMQPAPINNNMELLSIYTKIGVKPRKNLEQKGNRASTTDGYWIVKKGDFIVNKLLAWMGAIGLSDYNGVTSPAYDILRPQKKINGKFYHFLFRTKQCSSELKRHSKGIMEMRLRLYFDKFGVILIPLPLIEEQESIVKHIETQTTKIDTAIKLQRAQIVQLQAYQRSLIDSAVRGRIKLV